MAQLSDLFFSNRDLFTDIDNNRAANREETLSLLIKQNLL